MFADVVPALIAVMKEAGYDAGVKTPEHYSDKVFVKIEHMGGDYDRPHHADEPVVDISVLAAPDHRGGDSYGKARQEALRIRQMLIDLQTTRTPGGFLFDTTHPSGLIHVQNENPRITEFLITTNIRSRTRAHHIKESTNG